MIGVAAGGGGRPLPRDAYGNPTRTHKYIIFKKTMYGADLTQLWALGPTKLSVLFLYRRIFGVMGRKFNAISMSLVVLVICWHIAFFFTNMFQYYPIRGMWAMNPKDAHSTMKSSTKMFLAQSYADVALDIVIITVPMPLIWKLQMDVKKKIGISCIFLLGALTVAASAARTAVQYGVAKEFEKHNPDITYYLSPINYWPIIEASLGIVGACLPLLRPIGHVYTFRNLYLVSSRALSKVSRISGSSKGSSRESNESHSSKPNSIQIDVQRDIECPKNERWLKIYHDTALDETIDQKSQI
ncbi:hypothetical protein T440DRAFT_510834 [Plenodomus tracheiphilus IPT5]|uniref:Rhodopsin domain-containing protein n=1 Tax=Plenodomus tracheiphilus IPT5 TaxID=1408161 RepID=A0A6A7ATD3_9PLEO|nr:hypothetical protein T440DRAFT_510834 [Plenodomus tracheiphilus IPT5]